MYAFGQRSDTVVFDEPLYAAYLTMTGAERPYREQVLREQDNDPEAVMQFMASAAQGKHVYAKQMGKFINCVQSKWLKEGVHVVLVRDPLAVVASFGEVVTPTLEETCYPALCRIVSELRSNGCQPIVVLSEDLVRRPEATLQVLCDKIGITFSSAMLRWPEGPKPYDGCWAQYWYRNVHKSTGWEAPTARELTHASVTEDRRLLLHECYAMYSLLVPHALGPKEAEHLHLPDGRTMTGHAQEACLSAVPVRELVLKGEGELVAAPALEASSAGREPMKMSTHSFAPDARNANILVGIRDGVSRRFSLVWRPAAKVSVLDAGYVLGDGVWEGIRVHKGTLLFLEPHLRRLYQGAKALDIALDLTPAQLAALLHRCLDANGMRHASGVHMRLMVTRGLKPTPYQNPLCILGAPTIVIVPEWKEVDTAPTKQGIRLTTVHVRRGPADVQDQALNSHSKLNCITACIAANKAGADEGLMLDPHGFVATCNSVNFFIVVLNATQHEPWAGDAAAGRHRSIQDLAVWAPTGKYQLHGITRTNVLRLCREHSIGCQECDFTLTEVYSAAEAFVTGTFAGVIPVVNVDGRTIGDGKRGQVTARLQELYQQACDSYAEDTQACGDTHDGRKQGINQRGA